MSLPPRRGLILKHLRLGLDIAACRRHDLVSAPPLLPVAELVADRALCLPVSLTERAVTWWLMGHGTGGMEMIRYWAIIGAGNTRKSSTMRALTGAFGCKPCWGLARSDGGRAETVEAFIDTTSPQERKVFLTPNGLVQIIQKAHALRPVSHVLVCLRATGGRGWTNADAEDYLEAFEKQGWKEGGVVRHTAADAKLPANELAARLRRDWRFT